MDNAFYDELTELIDKYGLNKTEKDAYDKLVKDDGDAIKAMMAKAELKKYSANNFTASYVVQDRSSFDEAKILSLLHAFNIPDSLGIIKTKEYIDEDALESAIYNNELPEDVINGINDCKIIKNVATLRVSLNKGGE